MGASARIALRGRALIAVALCAPSRTTVCSANSQNGGGTPLPRRRWARSAVFGFHRGPTSRMFCLRVQLGASSSAVEQRTHNPTGRRFESYLAYLRHRHAGWKNGGVNRGCLHSPFPEPAVTITLACFDASAIRGSDEGLQIALKDA